MDAEGKFWASVVLFVCLTTASIVYVGTKYSLNYRKAHLENGYEQVVLPGYSGLAWQQTGEPNVDK